MLLKLCACCLVVVGLCSCNRLSKAEEPENNLGLLSLHLTRAGDIPDVQVDSVEDDVVGGVLMNKQRRCSSSLCCPISLYCCSNMTCCKGSGKRSPQRPCKN